MQPILTIESIECTIEPSSAAQPLSNHIRASHSPYTLRFSPPKGYNTSEPTF